MSKHTPGPWEISGDLIIGSGKVVCKLAWDFDGDRNAIERRTKWQEAESNGRVIIVAPDLLKSLTDVLAEFGNFCCENCINEEEMLRDHPELVEAINQADSLLKKVRGT